MTKKTIVVLGGTGHQGGAVLRSLLSDARWHVRCVSRNPHSEMAKRLTLQGVELVRADIDRRDTLHAAFSGAYGVFSVQSSEQGATIEIQQGKAVADAALAARVKHFVYSSVGGADRRSRVPHFDSKWQVEEYIRRIGLPVSIVRPVFFMDNLVESRIRTVLMLLMKSYLPKEKKLQMIATADIGKWVANAFSHPDKFIGKAEEIAGDELTRLQIVAALRQHGWSTGLPFPIPRLLLRLLPYDARRMFEWFGESGYAADISGLRSRQPELLTLDDWLRQQNSA
ncbi:hypothetical protein BHU62_04945 [Serratia marcescens]|uniref:NmrA-like domain-containing protein n=1 Tax=Serratia marcescens TaxID=615 RepID=A0A1Q4P3P8_SERMA|nr:NmrA/HSCARG family protein [Serratia marcescens]OKB67792.1 hypothetical protein BHU62_04945 [Serratia marcescens]